MNQASAWKPSTVVFDQNKHDFVLNLNAVYAGSWHAAQLQWMAYKPLFNQYVHGRFLDCGCGRIPYYQWLKEKTTLYYAVDWSENEGVRKHLDEVVDLNATFSLVEKNFDTILMSDVIAHVKYPATLIRTLSDHLVSGGHLLITTPFIYWASEYPHNYFNPSEGALKQMCEDAGLEVIHLEPYGGHADVLLDTLNKTMTGKFSHRLFRLLASVLKSSGWYKRKNEKSRYSYALGYTLAARKR
ncbi:MAG: class I SAM-dependent methyltransferase [Flavobacteriales bacterium]|nr:class I SAM-dependent methyltransferase [Flavobacteriales bacterium]